MTLCALVAALFIASSVSSAESVYNLRIVAHYPWSKLPAGTTVRLRGDNAALGLNWTRGQDMQSLGDGTKYVDVSYNLQDVGAKLLQAKVILDEKAWQIGANEVLALPNGDQYHNVWHIYPWFFQQQGSIELHPNIFAPQFQDYRDVIIYLPPSFYENPYKVQTQVLIMHDGQNLFNASTSFGGIAWMCQNTVDALVNEGTMREIVIVGVYNPDAARTDQYTYSYDKTVQAGGQADKYLDWLYETMLPQVKQWYPSRMAYDRDNLGMLGSSLGGLLSCYACWTRSEHYSKCGCMSSSFWWNSQDFNSTILVQHAPPPGLRQGALTLYLDSGNQGPGQDDLTETLTVRAHLESLGMSYDQDLFYYLDKGGMHNEKYWGDRFHVPMSVLYPIEPQQAAPSASHPGDGATPATEAAVPPRVATI